MQMPPPSSPVQPGSGNGAQAPPLRVNDELVWLGASAVLRCRQQQQQQQPSTSGAAPETALEQVSPAWRPLEWFTSDGLLIVGGANATSDYYHSPATAMSQQPAKGKMLPAEINSVEAVACATGSSPRTKQITNRRR